MTTRYHRMTEEQKEKRRQDWREWAARNPEKIKQHNERRREKDRAKRAAKKAAEKAAAEQGGQGA